MGTPGRSLHTVPARIVYTHSACRQQTWSLFAADNPRPRLPGSIPQHRGQGSCAGSERAEQDRGKPRRDLKPSLKCAGSDRRLFCERCFESRVSLLRFLHASPWTARSLSQYLPHFRRFPQRCSGDPANGDLDVSPARRTRRSPSGRLPSRVLEPFQPSVPNRQGSRGRSVSLVRERCRFPDPSSALTGSPRTSKRCWGRNGGVEMKRQTGRPCRRARY